MASWLSALFSSREIVKQAVNLADDTVRGVGNWIDEQQLTDEERVKYRLKQLELYDVFLKRAAEESGARTITRRVLAVAIAAIYLLFVLAGAVLGVVNQDAAAWLIRWMSATDFHLAALAVLSFYFGVHLLRGLKR